MKQAKLESRVVKKKARVMSYLKKDEASKGFDRGLTVLSDTNLLNGVRRQSTSTLLYSVPAASRTTSLSSRHHSCAFLSVLWYPHGLWYSHLDSVKLISHQYQLQKCRKKLCYRTRCLCFLSLSLKLAIEWAIAPVSTFLCFIGSFEL